MSNIVVALVTATVVTLFFASGYLWQGRQHRGKHSYYDRDFSAGAVIRLVKPSIERDRAAHRELQDRVGEHESRRVQATSLGQIQQDRPGRHRQLEPEMVGTRIGLLANDSTLLCGHYGGGQ